MFHTFFNGLDELYHHAKFGEIEQRAPAIDAKIWCLYVLIFLSRYEAGALFDRGVHNLYKQCVAVYRPISTRFSDFFLKGWFFSVASWRQQFHEIAVQNFEVQKSAEKGCASHLVDN